MEGYLKKKHPKINGRWDKRYVQLYDNKLMTFMSKDKKKGLNHVSLSGLDVKITDPRHFEFIIGNTVDLWFIFRANSREEMDEWVTAIGNSISVENKRDIKTITVNFLDSYKIPVAVNPHETTAEDVWWAVCETLNLAPEARTCFFIWVASDELELLLRGDDLIARIQEEWPLIENQFGVINRSPCRFVFRTSISLNLATERKIKDTRAVHLFFIQSMFNVKRQNYVVSKEDAVHLAATEAQIRLGNYDKDKHQNYIVGNLAMYIPGYLIKAYSAEQWERLIAFEHQKLANKDKLILELLYLQRVRMKPYYGSTFVHAKIGQASIKDTGFFGQEATSGSTIVGLNMEGIHLVNPNNHRLLRSFLWNQISNWQVTPEGKSFIFRAFNRDKNEYEVFNLHTVKAPIILDMILDVIYELKNQKAVIKEIRKSQSGMLRPSITSAVVSNASQVPPNNVPNKEAHVINPAMNYGNGVNQPSNLVSNNNPPPRAQINVSGAVNVYPEDVKVKKSPREHEPKKDKPRKSSGSKSSSSGSGEKHHKPSNWSANMYPFQSSENLHA